jgi:hypothetical protein
MTGHGVMVTFRHRRPNRHPVATMGYCYCCRDEAMALTWTAVAAKVCERHYHYHCWEKRRLPRRENSRCHCWQSDCTAVPRSVPKESKEAVSAAVFEQAVAAATWFSLCCCFWCERRKCADVGVGQVFPSKVVRISNMRTVGANSGENSGMFAHSVINLFPSITRVNYTEHFHNLMCEPLSRDIGSGISAITTSKVTLYDFKYVG